MIAHLLKIKLSLDVTLLQHSLAYQRHDNHLYLYKDNSLQIIYCNSFDIKDVNINYQLPHHPLITKSPLHHVTQSCIVKKLK
jgi:hypothetical protein